MPKCDICGMEEVHPESVRDHSRHRSEELVCPVHCSVCDHDRKYEDGLGFCELCNKMSPQGPCAHTIKNSILFVEDELEHFSVFDKEP